MIEHVEKDDSFAAHCKACNRLLTNPGYNRQSVFCCGKYRRWYDDRTLSYDYDDGRDARGRYHHKPGIVPGSRKIEINREGGH